MKKLLILAPAAALAACSVNLPGPGPGPAPAPVLAGTNWRVASVNGRPTPPQPEMFYMNFAAASFGSKFGCNGMGADYVQRGNILDAGPVIGTKMACPDMSYEIQAAQVLDPEMVVTWNGPSSIRLTSRGGTIELVR